MGFLWSKLKEETTWAGLVSLATAGGLVFTQIKSEAIIALGMAIIGAILAYRKDKGV